MTDTGLMTDLVTPYNVGLAFLLFAFALCLILPALVVLAYAWEFLRAIPDFVRYDIPDIVRYVAHALIHIPRLLSIHRRLLRDDDLMRRAERWLDKQEAKEVGEC